MPSSLASIFDIAGSAMTAQSQRLNVVSSNLANADSVAGSDGAPYRAKQVVFEEQPVGGATGSGVHVVGVIEDPSPGKRVYDPRNPLADASGYVSQTNVNVVDEMVNMISAARAYQNSVDVMNTAKTLMLKTLTLGQ